MFKKELVCIFTFFIYSQYSQANLSCSEDLLSSQALSEELLMQFPSDVVHVKISSTIKSPYIHPFEALQPQSKDAQEDFEAAYGQVTILDHNHLPLVFQNYRDDFTFHMTHDWKALEGKTITGYNSDRGGPRERFTGTVETVSAEADEPPRGGPIRFPQLYIGLRNLDGGFQKLTVPLISLKTHHARIWILSPQKSTRTIVKQAMETSRLESLVERAFGSPALAEDYKVALAVVETALSLPPGAAGTAVIKTLLGRKVKNGESFKHYGLLKGQKRYNEPALKKFVTPLYIFMEAVGILGPDLKPTKLPEWIKIRKKTALAEDFKVLWQDIQKKRAAL